MDNLNIISFNCRGINNSGKRKKVFQYLKKKKANIYCLQDTHFTSEQEQLIKQEWGYKHCYVNFHKSNSRGTAILFNNNFAFKIKRILYDEINGNYTALDISV